MKRPLRLMTATAALALATTFTTAEPLQDPVIGDPSPAFSLDDVATGETHNLADYQGKVVVLTYQSINCPWNFKRESAGYERYLAPLSQRYADRGVVFLAINSNRNESIEEIASYHEENAIPYPILKDPDNIVADAYNARTTPHIYIIAADEAQTLLYMGGIEQIPTRFEEASQMDEQYLEPVLNAVLAGEELPYTKTSSTGCGIQRVSQAE